MTTPDSLRDIYILESSDAAGNVYRSYFREGETAPYLATVNAKVTAFSVVVPIRGEDYPALAKVWENEEDDRAFD